LIFKTPGSQAQWAPGQQEIKEERKGRGGRRGWGGKGDAIEVTVESAAPKASSLSGAGEAMDKTPRNSPRV